MSVSERFIALTLAWAIAGVALAQEPARWLERMNKALTTHQPHHCAIGSGSGRLAQQFRECFRKLVGGNGAELLAIIGLQTAKTCLT